MIKSEYEKKLLCIYINKLPNTTFYIGVTYNLLGRIIEHKSKLNECFSSRYNLNKLVYFEITDSIEAALNREKQLKRWHREWKINLIYEHNKGYKDLSYDIGFTDELLNNELN